MLYRKLIPAIAIIMTLSACSSTEGLLGDIDSIFRKQPEAAGEVVYLDPLPEGDVIEDGRDFPMPPTYEMNMGYDKVATEMSGSSVELYSLDGDISQPVVADEPIRILATNQYDVGTGHRKSAGRGDYGFKGIESSTDPSVTIFPFSNDMYTPGIHAAARNYVRDPKPQASGFATDGPAFVPANIDSIPMFVGNPNAVYFSHGSAALSAVARQAIASAALTLKDGRITVEGHASQRAAVADPVKRAEVNMRMSMKRAMAVTKALIQQGIPAEMIKTTALGDTRLAVPEIDAEAEAINRRVQILQRP